MVSKEPNNLSEWKLAGPDEIQLRVLLEEILHSLLIFIESTNLALIHVPRAWKETDVYQAVYQFTKRRKEEPC